VKALRLQQINTLESANEFLDHVYLDELNLSSTSPRGLLPICIGLFRAG